jgi:hypothetical protein
LASLVGRVQFFSLTFSWFDLSVGAGVGRGALEPFFFKLYIIGTPSSLDELSESLLFNCCVSAAGPLMLPFPRFSSLSLQNRY